MENDGTQNEEKKQVKHLCNSFVSHLPLGSYSHENQKNEQI